MEPCPYCGNPVPPDATRCPACGSVLHPITQNLPQGTRLLNGRYTLGKVLGQGGFGITYLGADTRTQQPVAIKELFPEGSSRQPGSRRVVPPTSLLGGGFTETMQKFEDEAKVMAKFNHPGIVRVFDVFEENGTAYLVMEFLRGETLGKRIEKQGKLSAAEVQDIALKLTDALEVVHKAGLLHRDIKPDNVFLLQDGRVVLIDFGSARQFAFGKTVSHTRLVTPGYAPLEQYGTAGKFGPYTDIYALGATLYHALMGVVPPAATDRIQNNAPLKVPPATPDSLENAINRALEIRVDQRPQTIAEFRALLQGSRPKPAPAPSPTGSLLIRVKPSDTAVRVQGNNFQKVVQGDTDLSGLAVGSYTLYAQARGYQPQQVKIQIKPGNQTEVRFTLAPVRGPVPVPAPNPVPNPTPQPAPAPQPQPAPAPSPTPSPAPAPRAPGLANLQLNLYTLGAVLALFYLLFEVRPVFLQTLLQPVDEQLRLDYTALVPAYPEVFPWLRAGLYTAIGMGVFYTVGYMVTRVPWLLPVLTAGGLFLAVGNDLISPENAGALGAALVALYLGFFLLERYWLPLAFIAGLAAALRWADPAKGEVFSLGGIAVALLIVCFGGIVRLTRERGKP